MRKYLIGFIIGVAVTAASSAYADEIQSIIGLKVEGTFPVKVDGKTLAAPAAVIDGSSYLPVRAIGEALNKDVTFDADLGIELKEKEASTVPEMTEVTPVQTNNTLTKEEQIKQINEDIENTKALILTLNMFLHAPGQKTEQALTEKKAALEEYEAKLEDLQKQLADLEAQQ